MFEISYAVTIGNQTVHVSWSDEWLEKREITRKGKTFTEYLGSKDWNRNISDARNSLLLAAAIDQLDYTIEVVKG
jgi:hypothetical protein